MNVTKRNQCFICELQLRGDPGFVGEYEGVVIFMSRAQRPQNQGHVGYAPKGHITSLANLDDRDLRALGLVAHRLARFMEDDWHAEGVTLHQHVGAGAGAHHEHLHGHVVPRFHGDDYWAAVGEREEEFLEVPASLLRRQAQELRIALGLNS